MYIGPMFAGKSSTILGILRRNDAIERKTLCLTSDKDTRYAVGKIVSHDHESYPARVVKKLSSVIQGRTFHIAHTIVIEEAQFFPDLKEFVLLATETYLKEVIVVGLDGDSQRRPFGQILDLIPYCDTVHKLTALCKTCGDGTPALFSHRKEALEAQVAVGAQDSYEALCRWHYLDAIKVSDAETYISAAVQKKTSSEVELNKALGRFGIEEGTRVFSEIIRRRLGF
jgi:thymidine kinase